MRATLLAVLFVGIAAAQDAPKGDPKLVGEWTVVSAIKGGEKIAEEQAKAMLVVFTDKAVTVKEDKREEKAEYKADPSAKVKTIDVVPEKAPPGTVVKGIYELNGDELKLTFNKDGDRPKDFKGEGDTVMLMVLKRKK